jgi:hypothetical protein
MGYKGKFFKKSEENLKIKNKIISSDSKAIKRPREVDKAPTLEIQPLNGSSLFENNLRVKVRYK